MTGNGQKPNVLLITCDQWRADCLSAAGHPAVKTPNADALAREGVLFRQHYAGAAPCSPARACLYTGLYQMNNRVCRNGTPLDARHDNIALAARRAGYDPTLFGYTDAAPDPRRFTANDPVLRSYEGVLPGFTVRCLLPEHQKPWLSWLAARGVDSRAGFPDIHRPAGRHDGAITNAAPVYSKDETPAAFLAGEFIRWLGEQERATPWFAHVSFLSPHPPFIVPEPYNTMYDASDGPAFDRASTSDAEASVHPFLAYELSRQRQDNFLPGAGGRVTDWDEDAFRKIRAIYYGMVSEVDAQLGNVLSALRLAGMWENTIIILTSDHAEMMGDHFMLGKGGFFDGSYRIPLIICDPRRQGTAGAVLNHFTEAVDIVPTVIELLGGEAPPHLDGRSLKPFLEGREPSAWRTAAHWEYDFRSVSGSRAETHFGIASQQCNLAVLRSQAFKYVHFGGGLPALLYDLEKDSAELVNVAEDPAYLAIRLEMAERLLAWRAEHLDQSLALVELTEDGICGRVPSLI
ncbi:MAG: alkaline phosphatase family protein [Mesorhizobium sp.]